MKRVLAASFAFAVGFAGVPAAESSCTTKCGMTAPGHCVELQGLEARAVKLYGELDWGSEADVCRALKGWRLTVHARRPSDDACFVEKSWILSAGTCVLGYTHKQRREVELPDTDWKNGAYAHELVHVLDIEIHGRSGHCLWQTRGIKAALQEIQGRPDETDAEPFCISDTESRP